MEYKVVISETCLEEIEDICKYIETKLKAEKASNRLRIKIRDNIRNLNHSPERFATAGRRDRKNREYRKIIIDNYVILYTIIEEDKEVLVSHMYYTGKDKTGKYNFADSGIFVFSKEFIEKGKISFDKEYDGDKALEIHARIRMEQEKNFKKAKNNDAR